MSYLCHLNTDCDLSFDKHDRFVTMKSFSDCGALTVLNNEEEYNRLRGMLLGTKVECIVEE